MLVYVSCVCVQLAGVLSRPTHLPFPPLSLSHALAG